MKLNPEDIQTSEVLTWQGVHLLHYHMSSCSQKVRILMGELGIEYTSHHVDLRRNEQKSSWYLGINPNGVVPVLVHNGEVHTESNDIIQYLHTQFATVDSTLLPTHPEPAAQMRALLELEDQRHVDLRTVTFRYLAPNIHGDEQAEEHLDTIGRLHAAFTHLDAQLAKHEFLLGESLTLADIAWFITVHRLVLARYPLVEHPHLAAYYRRLAQRPAFKHQASAGPTLMRVAGAAYRTLNRSFKRSLARDFKRWQRSLAS